MSEIVAESQPFDISIDKDVQIIFMMLFGQSGFGKTLFGLAETFACCVSEDVHLLITNVKIVALPPELESRRLKGEFEIFYSGDIRAILEKMIASKGVRTVIYFDELGKSLSSMNSHNNFVLWITEITSSARKYDVVAFVYTDQARKASHSKIRANNSLVIRPRHLVNKLDQPMAYLWTDPADFENDYNRGESSYKHAVFFDTVFPLDFLRSAYDTRQILALNMEPTISEEDAPVLTKQFLEWCGEKGFNLRGESDKN